MNTGRVMSPSGASHVGNVITEMWVIRASVNLDRYS